MGFIYIKLSILKVEIRKLFFLKVNFYLRIKFLEYLN